MQRCLIVVLGLSCLLSLTCSAFPVAKHRRLFSESGPIYERDDDNNGDSKGGRGNTTIAVFFLQAANITVENSTIFAPDDKAFMKFARKMNVTNTTDFLQPPLLATTINVLQYHVVPGRVLYSSLIPNGTTVLPTAFAGNNITVTKKYDDGEVEVKVKGAGNKDRAEVKKADIALGSNVVHVIDMVLQP